MERSRNTYRTAFLTCDFRFGITVLRKKGKIKNETFVYCPCSLEQIQISATSTMNGHGDSV